MPASHSQLRALVEQALDLASSAEREALLAACPDAELVAEARALLGLQARAALLDAGAAPHLPVAVQPTLPERIGPYRILGLLGAGGMGEVYHGVRDDGSFRKDVAIKVVRDLHSAEQRARFQRERALLARLEHPGIARVLDGGVTDAGLPWMAIERVEGLPLDQYVRGRELPLRERIALLLGVLDAVQFAHQHLIVHRDLKPSNVLVQADGQPRLLDFGVAKLLGEEEHTQTAGRAPMTFAYAAPEQVKGEAITTATDVYALGVMLYELLTGERPHKLRGDNPLSLLQAITDTDATAPSENLRRRSVETTGRGEVDVREVRALRGDLDTIVLKALSRDPARRYHSVRAFAEDLERYLADRPILARPESLRYRLGKWVRRNRALAASLMVLLLTALSAAGITWHLARQNQLRTEQALRSARAAQSLQRVLTGMFQEADLIRQDRAELSVDTLLAIAQARAERDLRDDPDLLIGVSSVLANGVFQVVDRQRGAAQLRALYERLKAGAAVDADTRVLLLTQYHEATSTIGDMHAVAEVGPMLEQAMREIPRESSRWASARLSLLALMNDKQAQEAGFRELLGHPAVQADASLRRWTQMLLANVMRLNGQAPQAQAILEAEIAALRVDGTPLEQAYFLDRLARIQKGEARLASMREVDALMTAQLGAGHPLTQQKRFSLVLNLQATDPDPALDAELVALIDARRASGGIQYFSMLSNYLDELNARRQFARARVYAAEVLRLRDEIGIAADHPFHGSAVAQGFASRAQAGEAGLEAELDGFVGAEAQSYYRAMALAAKASLQLARRDCAAVRQTLAVFETTGDPASRLKESRYFRGECALIESRPDEARSAFEELVAADRAEPHLGRMIGARAQVRLARLVESSDPQRASELLRLGLPRLQRYLPADDPWWGELGLQPPR